MTSSINWALYHSFLAVMEHGSLSGAARALGLTQPTIGRHINELEKALGVGLFVRSQKGLLATDVAYELLPQAQKMANIAASMVRSASCGEGVLNGTVRLSASEIVGIEILPKVLSKLQRAHPELKIEMTISDSPHDLLNREADIALRMFRPTQNALVARLIGQLDLGMFAHRSYLDQYGAPQNISELQHHTLIGFDTISDYMRSYVDVLPMTLEPSLFQYRADSSLAQLAMLRAGVGIGVCQSALVADDGDILPLLEGQIKLQLEMWLTMHEDLKRNRACKAVFDFLSEELELVVRR